MPTTIRIMNWNVRTLSFKKLKRGNGAMAANLAEVIIANNVDVVILLEVRMNEAASAMTALSVTLNPPQAGGTNDWHGFFLSRLTGGEYYGMLIRNLDVVRLVYPIPGAGPSGTSFSPLSDLTENEFAVWPGPNFGISAYPLQFPQGPPMPLVDLFAKAGRRQKHFSGQPFPGAGYSEGRGFRLPAMPILAINAPGGVYFVPIVVCHYAAASSTNRSNNLAQAQVAQLRELQIAQMFNAPLTSGCVAVRLPGGLTAVPIQELLFTGDFNIDFLQNLAGVGATRLQQANRIAYGSITPTVEYQDTYLTPAAVPTPPPNPLPPVPFLRFPPPPDQFLIGRQALRTAVTSAGTILGPLPNPYVTGALDNFFFGGTCLNSAPSLAPNQAALVYDIPFAVSQRTINLAAVAASYAAEGKFNAANAPNLQNPAAVLTPYDCGVGANLLSDHLPVVLQFDCA